MLAEPRILKEKHIKLKLARGVDGSRSTAMARGMDALGWRMAERLKKHPLAFGDSLDVAYRIEKNTHPDFGGTLQLVLCDFVAAIRALASASQ